MEQPNSTIKQTFPIEIEVENILKDLLRLNHDCILAIFERMSIFDLCQFALVHERFRFIVANLIPSMTNKSFKLKPKRIYNAKMYNRMVVAVNRPLSKGMFIDLVESRNLPSPLIGTYTQYTGLLSRYRNVTVAVFRRLKVPLYVIENLQKVIETLTIDARNFDNFQRPVPKNSLMKKLIHAVAEKCTNLTNLELVDIFSIDFNDQCRAMFSRLHRFMFLCRRKKNFDVTPYNILLTEILKLEFPNLKELEIIGYVTVNLKGIKCPELESFAFKNTSITSTNILTFLAEHTRLKSITFWIDVHVQPLSNILDHIRKPEDLEALSIHGININVTHTDKLKKMTKLKKLEINLRDSFDYHMTVKDANQLLDNLCVGAEKTLECLHLCEVQLSKVSSEILRKIRNLKILKLTDLTLDDQVYVNLAKNLLVLQELHINSCSLSFNGAFDFVANLASPSLTTIVYYQLDLLNMENLNLARFKYAENIVRNREILEDRYLLVYLEKQIVVSIKETFTDDNSMWYRSQYVKFLELTKEQIRTTMEFGEDGRQRIQYNFDKTM